MQKLIYPVVAILVVGFVLAGCGKPVGAHPPTQTACTGQVEMATSTFVQSSCTIKAGDAVKFVDPSGSGNLHIICLGQHQQCAPNPDGPAELNVAGGVTFNAGDPPKSYTFTKAGTFHVTCTIHPAMDMVVTVQ